MRVIRPSRNEFLRTWHDLPCIPHPPISVAPGKPHPRWADPNYYDGDASDKWHTRSQKRNGTLPGTKQGLQQQQRRLTGGAPEHPGISVKTEPVNDLQQQQQQQQQQCYYRLSPSPPPPSSAASSNAPYSMGNGTANGQHYGGAFDGTGADGSPTSYSPSSPAGYSGSSSSSGFNGTYRYPSSSDTRKAYTRHPALESTHAHSQIPRDPYRGYEEACHCVHNPVAAQISRQLDTVTAYLTHVPEHAHGQSQKCGILRRIQELKSILQ